MPAASWSRDPDPEPRGIMSSTIVGLIVALCVAVFSSVTAPLILAHRTERMHREDRLADYKRQDDVAAQAAEAAALLLEQNRRVALREVST